MMCFDYTTIHQCTIELKVLLMIFTSFSLNLRDASANDTTGK